MKGFPRIAYAAAATITLFAALSISQIQQAVDQGQKQDTYQSQLGRAKTIPNLKSDVIITVKVAFENGESMLVSQRDGGMIRLRRNDEIIGLAVYLPQGVEGPVSLRQFQIEPVTKGGEFVGEKMTELNTFDLSRGSLDYKIDDLTSTIELVKVRNEPGIIQDKNFMESEYGTLIHECCVTCGGVEACACAVIASCGRCCAGPCCR